MSRRYSETRGCLLRGFLPGVGLVSKQASKHASERASERLLKATESFLVGKTISWCVWLAGWLAARLLFRAQAGDTLSSSALLRPRPHLSLAGEICFKVLGTGRISPAARRESLAPDDKNLPRARLCRGAISPTDFPHGTART